MLQVHPHFTSRLNEWYSRTMVVLLHQFLEYCISYFLSSNDHMLKFFLASSCFSTIIPLQHDCYRVRDTSNLERTEYLSQRDSSHKSRRLFRLFPQYCCWIEWAIAPIFIIRVVKCFSLALGSSTLHFNTSYGRNRTWWRLRLEVWPW